MIDRLILGRFNTSLTVSIILLMVAFVLFQPIVRFVVHEQVDYANHLSYLQDKMDWVDVQHVLSMFPHFMYHLLVYLVFVVFSPSQISDAAFAVSIVVYLVATLSVYWLLMQLAGAPHSMWERLLYAVLTLSIMVLMPIDIFTPTNLLVGYIGINTYHNPTIVLLKPFALVLFWSVCSFFRQGVNRDEGRGRSIPVWLCALVGILCVIAKPSYIIALFPALILVAAYHFHQHRYVDWSLFIFGFLIPTLLCLIVQLFLFRNSQGFTFSPLEVIYSWTRINPDAPNGILGKFLLSILFPLLVYVTYWKSARMNVPLNLAWLVLGVGAAYMYLLAERGERLSHANFTWSAISALFVLFVVSIAFVIQQHRQQFPEKSTLSRLRFTSTLRLATLSVVLGLHILSGIYWYYVHLTATSMGAIISNKW